MNRDCKNCGGTFDLSDMQRELRLCWSCFNTEYRDVSERTIEPPSMVAMVGNPYVDMDRRKA